MTTTRPWRQEIELLQNYPNHSTFTLTTTDVGTGGVAGLIELEFAGSMEECNKISLVVEEGPAYVTFDETVTLAGGVSNGMYIPQDEGYFDDAIYIGTKISVIRATATNVRVRGIAWGR